MEERLQKYIARCGIASRRNSEEMILAGKVKVNETIIRELGTKINPLYDKVYINDKLILPESEKLYLALHKPVGYVTTVKDEKNRSTVIDLINVSERIYPIGRLDYNTSGLLLLTNDGNIYNKIIHPRQALDKVYVATIKGIITQDEISRFSNGIDIGGYITAPSSINILKIYKDTCKVKITIHEGKNRQIRKMCDAIGHTVIDLKRISVGNIQLGDLESGKWRHLSVEELNYIRNL